MNNTKAHKYASEKLAREAADRVKKESGCGFISLVDEPSAVVLTKDDQMEGVVIVRFEW